MTSHHKPHRLWMTESFAVIMAALNSHERRSTRPQMLRHSPYSVGETILRIEAEALNQGLTVVAELEGAQPVIVLGSSIGGTPVMMNRADSQPFVPLSIGIRECPGGCEVFLTDPHDADTDWGDLPTAVADDIAALPRWVESALA
jgi:hypothetical protein